MYEVMLDGTEFITWITVRAEQPTQFGTESETQSESRSTSKPMRTATNKRFVEVQSDNIPGIVNQLKNRNILNKTLYVQNFLTSFLQQETINEQLPAKS